MPNIPRVVSTPVEFVPVLSARFALRFALCLLVTSLNVAVVAIYGGTLYRASSHHPVCLAGVTVLFGALLASLARVWFVALRRYQR